MISLSFTSSVQGESTYWVLVYVCACMGGGVIIVRTSQKIKIQSQHITYSLRH